METYQGIMNQLIETGDGAESTVWKYKVVEGQPAEDIELSLKTVATEHNIRSVGELPLYQQVSSMKGKPLPEVLKKEAMHVKEVIQDIMKRTAEGDF